LGIALDLEEVYKYRSHITLRRDDCQEDMPAVPSRLGEVRSSRSSDYESEEASVSSMFHRGAQLKRLFGDARTKRLAASFPSSSSKGRQPLSFSPELRRQYRNLNIYAFFVFWLYAYTYVFTPLYLVQKLELWELFVNWSISPILSLVVQNYWSKRVDDTNKFKKYILVSNLALAVFSVYTIYVSSFWMLLVMTVFGSIVPNGDLLANVLVYRLSDRVTSGIESPVEKRYHNINIFARYRRYGSIGFAFGLPIIGYVLNLTGLRSGINFWICALGLVLISIWFMHAIDERLILAPQDEAKRVVEEPKASPKKKAQVSSSLWQKYRALFSNRVYFGFILASFLYYIAYASTESVQGLFYNLISRDNFFELIWVYVIAALIEWPVMTVVAKQVKRIGWEKMMALVYVLSGIRWTIMPLIFILNGNILWGYLLQLYSGTLFGLNWPTTTFGLYVSLPDDQKALGQTFYGTMSSIAAFFGGLVGVVLSLNISDQYLMYYYLHWIAGIFGVLSGLLLYHFRRRTREKDKLESTAM
jgi:hypothetical protein